MRYTTTTYEYYCPNCKQVVKRKIDDEGVHIVLVILFPLGLLVLLIKAIINAFKEKTEYGEQIILCKHCGKRLAFSHALRSIRILYSKEEQLANLDRELEMYRQEKEKK